MMQAGRIKIIILIQSKMILKKQGTLEKMPQNWSKDSGFKHLQSKEVPTYSLGTIQECREIIKSSMMFMLSDEFKWNSDYEKVADWMSNTQGKGLLLVGGCGVGKSLLITRIIPLAFEEVKRKIMQITHADKLEKEFETVENRWCYVIDEVGCEKLANNFGVKYSAFMELMNKAEIDKKLCMFSSNLSSKQMIDKYDERTLDRINGLCRIIKIEGNSCRK